MEQIKKKKIRLNEFSLIIFLILRLSLPLILRLVMNYMLVVLIVLLNQKFWKLQLLCLSPQN